MATAETNPPEFKLVLVGDGGVGKSRFFSFNEILSLKI